MGSEQTNLRRMLAVLARPPYAAISVAVLLGVAACNQASPETSKTAEAMPDTSAAAAASAAPDVPVDLPDVKETPPGQ